MMKVHSFLLILVFSMGLIQPLPTINHNLATEKTSESGASASGAEDNLMRYRIDGTEYISQRTQGYG